ncbi:CGNR zinc finger domain-containing protein [Georgenia sp. H159]|uniref:CGNR zinc finger domain-containing protein n=1 Tax=Georgenia sp. H159 TaxID=3076115 RepID=UPI002D78BFB0|nr:CGNR zinc finger domain-containing protein [Georgenia sp. H159]
MDEGPDVPRGVRLVRDFVNTYEPQVDEETIATARALGEWLVGRGVITDGDDLSAADVERATTVREGLRQVLLDHAGHDADDAAIDALNRELAAAPVRMSFTGGGHRLEAAAGEPWHRALAGLLDAIRMSTEDGTWTRLKVCARDTCRWAFYDSSRNQARRWCSMAGCGNHVKMKRAYAARKERESGGSRTAP